MKVIAESANPRSILSVSIEFTELKLFINATLNLSSQVFCPVGGSVARNRPPPSLARASNGVGPVKSRALPFAEKAEMLSSARFGQIANISMTIRYFSVGIDVDAQRQPPPR